MSSTPSGANTSPREQTLDSRSVEAKEVLILGAGFTTRNMGVWALASSAMASVLHGWPNARIRLLDYSRQPASYNVKHSGGVAAVELVNIRFSKNLFLRNNIARLIFTALVARFVPVRSLKSRVLGSNPCLNAISRADVVGAVAGGDSFSDIYGMGRLLYVSLPQILVLLLRKPLVLLPQTLGPFKGLVAKKIGQYVLSRARVVYARDKESLEEVAPLVGRDPSRFKVSHDMAFALEPVVPAKNRLAVLQELTKSRPLVGFNISGLLHMGGYTHDNMFGLRGDYRQLVCDIIQYFIQEDAHVLLVPHVLGGVTNPESDTTACAEVYRELSSLCHGQLHLLEGEYDHQEIKYVIGKCDFFLGSRMHACIAALSQCVPAVGLAYSRKFKGVMGSIGMEGLVIDLCESDLENVMSCVQKTYNRRQAVRQQLEAIMPGVKESVLNLFGEVGAESGEQSSDRH